MSSISTAVSNMETLYKAIINNMAKFNMPYFNAELEKVGYDINKTSDDFQIAWASALVNGGINGLRYCPDRHSYNGSPLALKYQTAVIVEEGRTVLGTFCVEVRSKSNLETFMTCVTQEITAKGVGQYRHSKSLNVGKPKGLVICEDLGQDLTTAELSDILGKMRLGRAWVTEDSAVRKYGHETSPKSVDQWNIGATEMRNLWTDEMIRRNKDRLEGLSYEGVPTL
jgi:hypothetical protein